MESFKLPAARVWNHFVDNYLHLFQGDALTVVVFLLRRTVGFQKLEDAVSLSQFLTGSVTSEGRRLNHGTGLSKKRLLHTLHKLEEEGHILVERGKTARGGNMTNRYRLTLTEKALTEYHSDLKKASEVAPGVGASCEPGVGAPCGTKQGVPVQGVQINKDHHATNRDLPVDCPPPTPDDDLSQKRFQSPQRRKVKRVPGWSEEQLQLLERIRALGVSISQANRVLHKASIDRIKQALEYLPYRKADNPAGYFVREVLSENFAAPKALQLENKRQVIKQRRKQEELEQAEAGRAEEEAYRAERQAAFAELGKDQLRDLVEEARKRNAWARSNPEIWAEDSPVMQGMVLDLVAEGWLESRLGRRESKLNLPPPRGWAESRRGRLEAQEARA